MFWTVKQGTVTFQLECHFKEPRDKIWVNLSPQDLLIYLSEKAEQSGKNNVSDTSLGLTIFFYEHNHKNVHSYKWLYADMFSIKFSIILKINIFNAIIKRAVNAKEN